MAPSSVPSAASAAAPAHLGLQTDALNPLQNPQMGLGYLPDQMHQQNIPSSAYQSGRSTPSAYNPQPSQATQQAQLHQPQYTDSWNEDIAFLTALSSANNPLQGANIHNRRASNADIDALFLAPDALPQASLVEAPHPDLFDTDLENFLAAADPTARSLLETYNPIPDYNNQQFFIHRAPGTYSVPGPHSIITASSESGYDDGRSESYYNPYSPQGSLVNAINPTSLSSLNFAIDDFAALNFGDQAIGLDAAFGNLLTPVTPAPPNGQSLNLNPPGSGAINSDLLMPSSIASAQTQSSYDDGHGSDGSQHSGGSGGAAEREFGTIATGLPGQPYTPVQPQSLTDARKKYQCPSCPRAFARAFNLKTHMATHDPNRLKPYVCPHKACNRSFSRKHDLGRHLVSIHKDEAGLSMSGGGGSSARSTIGVPGHPLPQVGHSSAGRVHRVGGTDTPKHPIPQPPTLPNIPLKRNDGLASLANAAYPLHPSLNKQPNGLQIKGA